MAQIHAHLTAVLDIKDSVLARDGVDAKHSLLDVGIEGLDNDIAHEFHKDVGLDSSKVRSMMEVEKKMMVLGRSAGVGLQPHEAKLNPHGIKETRWKDEIDSIFSNIAKKHHRE
jgi:hypothetical protein